MNIPFVPVLLQLVTQGSLGDTQALDRLLARLVALVLFLLLGREIDERRAVARMRLPVPERKTRRSQPARRGPRVDCRASLRRALRPEGLTELRKRELANTTTK